MPYAQIAAAPMTRPMPPITAVQRPACPTMAAGMAAEVPLITFWCQLLVFYDIQMDEITHATELAALVALWAPVVAREAAELAPEVAAEATELAPEIPPEATEPAPEVATPPALVASEATDPAPPVTVFTIEPMAEPAAEVREETTRRKLSACTREQQCRPTLSGLNIGGSLDRRFANL